MCVTGTTAEEFVERPKAGSGSQDMSKMEILRGMLANKLRVPPNNVLIFSVMNTPGQSRAVDVRYAAHGSPFYRPDRLDGLAITHKSEVCTSDFPLLNKCCCWVLIFTCLLINFLLSINSSNIRKTNAIC